MAGPAAYVIDAYTGEGMPRRLVLTNRIIHPIDNRDAICEVEELVMPPGVELRDLDRFLGDGSINGAGPPDPVLARHHHERGRWMIYRHSREVDHLQYELIGAFTYSPIYRSGPRL